VTHILRGKSVIVTGAAGGIGRATSAILASAGANVVVSDLLEEGGRETVEAIRKSGGSAMFAKADLTSETDVRSLVQAAVTTFGRIDGAFNNAGLEQCALPIHELSTEQWERAIKVNLTGVFWCVKYQALAMLKTGGGSIVNTASSLGQIAIRDAGEYIAAKHGVIGLTRAAATDLGRSGIRVNAVLPGITRTPMVARLIDDPKMAAFFAKLEERHTVGRFGEPRDIGEAVKWLLSDAASFVNGVAMPVDGGFLSNA
jgi:NAD(P)-dependent dehydrogenase (short-subunit alcohol dehydrogenase family)